MAAAAAAAVARRAAAWRLPPAHPTVLSSASASASPLASTAAAVARRSLWSTVRPLPRLPPPPLPPGVPRPVLYALERAVVENRPLLLRGGVRDAVLEALVGAFLAASGAAFLWAHYSDGAELRPVSALAREYGVRTTPHLPSLKDLDLVALFDDAEYNSNNLGRTLVPTWWVYAESVLGAQVNAAVGATSSLLHADGLHLAADALLTVDAFLLLRALRTPWTPLYLIALMVGESVVGAPSFNAPPLVSTDDEMAEFSERLLRNRDLQWLRLYDEVHGSHMADLFTSMPSNEQFDDLSWEDALAASGATGDDAVGAQFLQWLTLGVGNLARAASTQVFWVLTLLSSYLSPTDLAAAVRPAVGALPLLSAVYMVAALEATFVAPVAASQYWLRVVALGGMAAFTYANPAAGQAGTPMLMVEPPWKARPGGGAPDFDDRQMEQEVPVTSIDGTRMLAGMFSGALTWVATMGPLRAMLYAFLRRRAFSRLPLAPPPPPPPPMHLM